MVFNNMTRRDFLKCTSALAAGMAIGLNPFKAEAAYFEEGRLKGNTFIANDGTEIDVTHLGKKEWNSHQKRVLEKSAEEFKAAGYSDAGDLYENLRKRFLDNQELGALITVMNGSLNYASKEERWYHEYKTLLEENKEFMKEIAEDRPNNPYILVETGISYDIIDVHAHGPHIDYYDKAVELLRKLPLELRFQEGVEGMVTEDQDFLFQNGYPNPIRGPPWDPITWDGPIRGPPYDTAKRFLEMATDDYPDNEDFRNELRWVNKRL